MIKKLFLAVVILFGISELKAQTLDRISLSSGGASTNEVNYVLGETFNFAIAGGDIIIETGTQGSTGNTGGDNNYTLIEKIYEIKPINCYPNPVSDILHLEFVPEKQTEKYFLTIYNTEGKYIASQLITTDIFTYNVNNLSIGSYFISIKNAKGQVFGVSKFVKQ